MLIEISKGFQNVFLLRTTCNSAVEWNNEKDDSYSMELVPFSPEEKEQLEAELEETNHLLKNFQS